MIKNILIITGFLFSSVLFGSSINDFIDQSKCDQIIDKQIYNVCYSHKYKGALSGWTTLDGKTVNAVNIKKRPRFYSEKNIPIKYRAKYKDYTGWGNNWNRGHMIVADADYDYNKKVLNKAYSMINISPMSAKLNQKTWAKVEKYSRSMAVKLGKVESVTIANYNGATEKIGNDIVIPTGYWRILFNNEHNFEKCFYYENKLDIDYKNDNLKDHLVDCVSLKKRTKNK